MRKEKKQIQSRVAFGPMLLFGFLLLSMGCEKETFRSPPVKLPAINDIRGIVTLDAMPVIRGSIVFDASTLNVTTGGWATIRFPGKGAIEVWGPSRLELNDLQTSPRFDLWEGRFMAYADKVSMEIVQGSVTTKLPAGSGGYFDRTQFDDYVCIGHGKATIDSAGHPLSVTGTGHRAFTQPVDGGRMFPTAVSWHARRELNALAALARSSP